MVGSLEERVLHRLRDPPPFFRGIRVEMFEALWYLRARAGKPGALLALNPIARRCRARFAELLCMRRADTASGYAARRSGKQTRERDPLCWYVHDFARQ